MSDATATLKIVCPTLHHYGLTVSNTEAMLDWYGKVLGTSTVHHSAKPTDTQTPLGARAYSAFAWAPSIHHSTPASQPRTLATKSSIAVLSPRLEFCESPSSLSAVGFFLEVKLFRAALVRFKLR